jgi:hypothetical protein
LFESLRTKKTYCSQGAKGWKKTKHPILRPSIFDENGKNKSIEYSKEKKEQKSLKQTLRLCCGK